MLWQTEILYKFLLMASDLSYKITVSNNKTEKEGIDFLLSDDARFLNPDTESRKVIMELLNLDPKFKRAFDLIMIDGHYNQESLIELHKSDRITLVELKTTKKYLPNNPKGFFFGATENEFEIANLLEDKYKFCFVSLHQDSKSYKLLNLSELETIIQNKRIQYQINLVK